MAATLFAQDSAHISKPTYNGKYDKKYCAIFKDGKMILTTGEKIVTTEVTLGDQSKVSPNCRITKKDGTQTDLNNGECIDANGLIIVHDKLRK